MKTSTRKNLIILAILLAVAELCVIFYLSSQNADDSMVTSGGLTQLFINIFYPNFDSFDPAKQQSVLYFAVNFVRKLAHFTEFAVLGLTLSWFCRLIRHKKNNGLIAWALGTLYAVTDEIHQIYVPGRAGRVIDVVLDSAGVAAGVGIFFLIIWIIAKCQAKSQPGPNELEN